MSSPQKRGQGGGGGGGRGRGNPRDNRDNRSDSGRSQRTGGASGGSSGGASSGGSYSGRYAGQRTERSGYRDDRWSGSGDRARHHSYDPRPSTSTGFRGRGGRRAVSLSPIRIDVRTIAQKMEIKAIHRSKEHGKDGRSVELIANHFPIEFKGRTVYRYDIMINLRRSDGKGMIVIVGAEKTTLRKERQSENRQIIDKMANEWVVNNEKVLKFESYVFDGNKNLFSTNRLNIGSEEETRVVIITLDGFPEQTFEVKIKYVKEVQMKKNIESKNTEDYNEVRQVLDIVMRDRTQRRLIPVGRNLFSRDPQNTLSLPEFNSSIAFGHHQSIRDAECGLTANFDRVTTVFKSDGPLIEFIKREFNRDLNDFKSIRNERPRFKFGEKEIKKLNLKIRDLKIFTEHIVINRAPQKRKHTIERMVELKPYEHRFETEPGIMVTLEEYFKTKYNKILGFREIPLIKIKGGTKDNPKYLPAEVCHVYPNQTMSQSLIRDFPDIQRAIVESTNNMSPLKRFDKIENSVQTVCNESADLMSNFGISISTKPIRLSGRELPPFKINGDNNRLLQTVPLKYSLFLNLSQDVESNFDQYFDNFFNHPGYGLIVTARKLNFNVDPPRVLTRLTDNELRSTETKEKAFIEFIKMVLEKHPKTQLIFVCIPDVSQLYDTIKHYSENRIGILTQCIKDKLFMGTKPGYFNNFLRKTNGKLNGQNQVLTTGQRPDIFEKNPTMVVGADVTHSGYHNPLARERVISSIAAVVGTYDKDFTKFAASVSAQPMNTEIISDFDLLFGNLLKQFFKHRKLYPKIIVLFRDGVSESQLDTVMSREVPLINKAYTTHKVGFSPQIVVFVVQKRHHTRLLLTEPVVNQRTKKENFNPKSGTVIDNTITNPFLKEFILYSQNGLLGTSRPAKYVGLRDDIKLTQDQLQRFAFSMCFTYVRCSTPISIPIPVKYADDAAYRAKRHLSAQHIQFERENPNETEQQKRVRETRILQNVNQKIKVCDNIVFLPYYC